MLPLRGISYVGRRISDTSAAGVHTTPRMHTLLRSCSILLQLLSAGALLSSAAWGHSDYFDHVFFDNSQQTDFYWNSISAASAPSSLEGQHGHLPVVSSHFHSPPNALRVSWVSQTNGSWDAEVHLLDFPNRLPALQGANLDMWLYSPEGIVAGDLPDIILSTERNGLQVAEIPGRFTATEPLGRFSGDIPAGHWVAVRIPMKSLASASVHEFHSEELKSVVLHQGRADGKPHTLLIDDIRVDDDAKDEPLVSLPVPQKLEAKGYDRHIALQWSGTDPTGLARYVIYRSLDAGKSFDPVGMQIPGIHRFADFVGRSGVQAQYRVTAVDWQDHESAPSEIAQAATRTFSDDELLTMLQEAAFEYYWDGAEPHSGMAYENQPGDDRLVATGASGFGVGALVVGVSRHFITRDQGLERVERIVTFLEHAPRYHGAWSHYMNGATGQTMALFGMLDNGGDLVETSFMMEGLLMARQYFNGPSARERELFSAFRACGKQWSGTGTDRIHKVTSFIGIGRHSGGIRSIIH